MGFLDLFKKKKKEITPEQLKEMMNDVREKCEFVKAIEDESVKTPQAEAFVAQALQVYAVVEETLASVEKHLQDLAGDGWWATAEVRGRDYVGLSNGKKTLLSYRAELENMVKEFSVEKPAEKKQEEPAGPSNG